MDYQRFRTMVHRLAQEIPERYLAGIVGVEVSRRTVPHPDRPGVYTLGECIPVAAPTDELLSRIVLYHGSFQAVARDEPGFDWRTEAWETLLHELRHHVEWRAGTQRLEGFDWAAEENFARLEGERFDPEFYREGERVADGVFRIDGTTFIERVVRRKPAHVDVEWAGRRYRVTLPSGALPLFLTLEGLRDVPSGEVVLVVRRKPSWRDLFRRRHRPVQMSVRVRPTL